MKKRKRRLFFPHNFLKKTARLFKDWGRRLSLFLNFLLKIFLLFSLFSLLFLNLHFSFFPENEELAKVRREVLISPLDSQSHLNLTKVYLGIGDLEAAEREFLLAKSLSSTGSPNLKNIEESLMKAKERPEKIHQEISFWKKIVKERPDYRDAYLQLAVLNYQISQTKEAKKYLQNALELDPNFEPAKKLEKLLSG